MDSMDGEIDVELVAEEVDVELIDGENLAREQHERRGPTRSSLTTHGSSSPTSRLYYPG